jgi:S-adenosylmethionine:tRNA ribosyltransferase-isomerase
MGTARGYDRRRLRTDDFDYELPEDLIAQEPAARREDARLCVLDRASGAVRHRGIADLPELLRPGDLLVVNDTRVVAARVFARRATGGRVEVFLLGPSPEAPGAWTALVRAGGALRDGEELSLEGDAGQVRALRRVAPGTWLVDAAGGDLERVMERAGHMPLPPYIRRGRDDPREAMDRERYQTVFASKPGAVAAPTAGLHLTEALLARLADREIATARLTLHVGLGTFKPIDTDDVEGHAMHEERYEIPRETADAVRRTRAAGGRVVAVGTTSVRTLESSSAASADGLPAAGSGATSLFITRREQFRVVDALLTNFHLPRSTLLVLVAAFAGRERVLAAYREAIRERYRFFSYGDAMLIS